MKKFNSYILLLTLAILSFGQLNAQEDGPFLSEIYDYEITLDVIYGSNETILPVLAQLTDNAQTRPMNMDVYSPVGDNNDERPVMLVLHTGNFLPHPNNNGTGGTIRDSTVVEACKRFARRGYVACAVDYRLGWNPIDPNQDIRTFFLINAAYRGIQDARSAIRYLRGSAVDGLDGEMNPFGISPDRIGAFGIGTGGYIVSGLATLDEYEEILLPKFLIDLGTGPLPMIIEGINGDINGTSQGVVPPGYPVLPAGDVLCTPNNVNYEDGSAISSDLNFAVNLGGAMGDETWLDAPVSGIFPPWVSFAVPDDAAAPYISGTLTVPGTNDPLDPSDDFAVTEVFGSYSIQQGINTLGFNNIFDQLDANVNDHSEVANDRNDGFNGLFPMPTDDATVGNEDSPWDFYAEDNAAVVNGFAPAPQRDLALTYWDTIMTYTTPRACLALDLDCAGIVGLAEIDPSEVGFQMAPNPASDHVSFSTKDQEMSSVFLYDLTGKMVSINLKVNSNTFELRRGNLADGMYMAIVKFKEGYFTQKVVFK